MSSFSTSSMMYGAHGSLLSAVTDAPAVAEPVESVSSLGNVSASACAWVMSLILTMPLSTYCQRAIRSVR